MRLLKVQEDGQLTLTKDLTSNILPPYAILSHTWGPEDEEVSFEDITKDTAKHKSGYKKIQFCANRVPHDGLIFFWVDTCCIDKSNNTELTTAINSMFKWYQNATKCYVYLSDVSAGIWEPEFRNSKWFTRGWTLQELIAPSVVEFFSLEGNWIGDKLTLCRQIYEITGISSTALSGSLLSDFSRRERMSWADGRITTREEDRAYSLIGIFEISLPLLYGEGVKLAFRRLEEEIDKREAFEKREALKKRYRSPDSRSCSIAPLSFKATGRMEPCLQSLLFPEMNTRRLSIEPPANETCLWLFSHPVYHDWFRGQGNNLIFLKGKPGAGKSTLMKEAFRRASLERHESENRVAAFFFSKKGCPLEKSLLGLYRSLLYQLLPGDEDLRSFDTLWSEKCLGFYNKERKGGIWSESELKNFFFSMFMVPRRKRVTIFIDALDECNEKYIYRIVDFWDRVTHQASINGTKLSVCISLRDFPVIPTGASKTIIVQNNNSHDITTYVEQKFIRSIAAEEPQWKLLKDKILHKSSGVFLWVVLVMDDLLKRWNDGESIQRLLGRLDAVPDELQKLFSHVLVSIDRKERGLTRRLFFWAILAVKPLRLYEWHHILAFIGRPPPSSLQEWRESDHFTRDDDQLEKKIKSLSRGLVEIRTSKDDLQYENLETISACAGAGSLSLGSGDTRIVQIIHESVREFFLKGKGFSILGLKGSARTCFRAGHLVMMDTCLDYINIKELDALIQARNRATNHCNEAADAKEWLEDQDESMTSSTSSLQKHEFYSQTLAQNSSYSSANRRHHKNAPDKPNELSGTQTPITEPPKNVPQPKFTEISQWLETLPTDKWSNDDTLIIESPLITFPSPPVTNRSEVLVDYPALLSYALYEFPTHSKLVELHRTLPRRFLDRLQQGTELDRWITLREDSTLVRNYLENVRPSTPIDTWLLRRRLQDLQGFLENQGTSFLSEGEKGQSPSRNDRSQASSVASFSSAGSHTGSRA